MTRFVFLSLALLTLAAPVALEAHHSVPVNFDQSKEITLSGVLTEVKWINPHSRFRMNVTGEDGKPLEWLVEMGAMNTMKRAGFPMDVFHVGDRVTITGNPGRRDRAMLLINIVLADGRKLDPTMRER